MAVARVPEVHGLALSVRFSRTGGALASPLFLLLGTVPTSSLPVWAPISSAMSTRRRLHAGADIGADNFGDPVNASPIGPGFLWLEGYGNFLSAFQVP